ncbi:MAG: A24 family peptidase C-terminal domain-containing protein [Nitrosopumilaceae archaeon]
MIESLIELNHLRIILAIGMLGYASFTDVTKREISDYIWIVFGAIAAILLIFEPNLSESLLTIGISLLVAPVGIIIWRIGLFGGADAFAIIVLAALVPQISFTDRMITPFTILTNAVLISISPLFINFFRNLIELAKRHDIFEGFEEPTRKRIMAMFLGYRAQNPKFGFSIEKKVGKHKKLNLVLHHPEYAEFCRTPNTWITPGVPYMLFITGGLIIQLMYGDIIFRFLESI